jgi:hypothetical protein
MTSASYQLNILLNGAAISSSPFSITITPGAISPSQCTLNTTAAGAITTTTLPQAVAGATQQLLLQTRDAFGNALTTNSVSGQVMLNVTGVSGTATSGVSLTASAITYSGGGVYTVSFAVARAGAYVVALRTTSGSHLALSPYTLTVTPAAVSLANTVISGTCLWTGGSSVSAVSGVVSRFGLLLRDGSNNTVTSGVASAVSVVITPACGK